MKMGLTSVRVKCQSIVNELHAVVSGVVPRRALNIVTFSNVVCQLALWVLLTVPQEIESHGPASGTTFPIVIVLVGATS